MPGTERVIAFSQLAVKGLNENYVTKYHDRTASLGMPVSAYAAYNNILNHGQGTWW
jgi:hypothetical protein